MPGDYRQASAGPPGYPLLRARHVRWRPGPVQRQPVNRVRAGRQQLSAETAVCRRSPGRRPEMAGALVGPEGCESGRIGTPGERVWGNSPWVRIPLPPLGWRGAVAAHALVVEGCRPQIDTGVDRVCIDAVELVGGEGQRTERSDVVVQLNEVRSAVAPVSRRPHEVVDHLDVEIGVRHVRYVACAGHDEPADAR